MKHNNKVRAHKGKEKCHTNVDKRKHNNLKDRRRKRKEVKLKTIEDYRKIVAEHPVLSSLAKEYANEQLEETLECMVTFQVEIEENGDVKLNEPIKKVEDMTPKEKTINLIRQSIVSTIKADMS